MPKWAYKIIDLAEATQGSQDKLGEEARLLNKNGADGWELVSVTDSVIDGRRISRAYFKREIDY